MTASGRPSPADLDHLGWGRPKDVILSAIAPQFAHRRNRQGLLAALRATFTAFALSFLMIGIVVLFLTADATPSGTPPVSTACLVVAGVGAVIAIVLASYRRTLACGDPGTVLVAYRTRMFVRIALAEVGALVGFVAVFFTNSPWPYFVGLPIALYNLIRFAPTIKSLVAEDQDLADRGCDVSLVAIFVESKRAADEARARTTRRTAHGPPSPLLPGPTDDSRIRHPEPEDRPMPPGWPPRPDDPTPPAT